MVAAHLFMGTPCASSQITVYAQVFNIPAECKSRVYIFGLRYYSQILYSTKSHQAITRFAFIARNMALSATSYAS